VKHELDVATQELGQNVAEVELKKSLLLHLFIEAALASRRHQELRYRLLQEEIRSILYPEAAQSLRERIQSLEAESLEHLGGDHA